MAKAKLIKRKVFTPMGKPDGYVWDLHVGKQFRGTMSHRLGIHYVKKLNKRRSK